MPIACNRVLLIKVTTISTNIQQLQIGPEQKYGLFQYQYSHTTGDSYRPYISVQKQEGDQNLLFWSADSQANLC